jgi:hypothetical protein
MPRPRRAARGKHKPLGTRGGVSEALRVNVLGGFEVSVGSRVVEKSAWQLRKAASLVKVLSLVKSANYFALTEFSEARQKLVKNTAFE